jgi:hypothetical protein
MALQHKFDNLSKWITKNGGNVSDNIGIKDTKNGPRIVSKVDIGVDVVLAYIPKTCIPYENIPSSMASWIGSDSTYLYKTVLCLMYDMSGKKNFYGPFFNYFPTEKDVETYPLMKKVSNDTFPYMSNMHESFLNDMEAKWSSLMEKNGKEDVLTTFSRKRFDWIYVASSSKNGNFGIIPLVDLFTSKYDSTISVVKDERGVSIITTKPILSGEYPTVTFLTNPYEFLITRGFRDPTIRTIHLQPSLTVAKNASEQFSKEEALRYITNNLQYMYITEKGPTQLLMGAFRVSNCDIKDIPLLVTNTNYVNETLTYSNERNAFAELLNGIKELSNKHTLTMKKVCNKMIEKKDGSTFQKMVARIFLEEYGILHNSYVTTVCLWNNYVRSVPMKPCDVNVNALFPK